MMGKKLLVFQTARVEHTIMCRGQQRLSQRKVRFSAQTGRDRRRSVESFTTADSKEQHI